jgi:hypothetical protein
MQPSAEIQKQLQMLDNVRSSLHHSRAHHQLSVSPLTFTLSLLVSFSLVQFIFQLEISAHELELAKQQNEREALSVGLNYFDKDQKGSISPSECPELSARLFATLDVNHDGLISHQDLQQAIEHMTDELEHKLNKIKALQREIEELKGKQAAGHTAEVVMVQIAQNEAMIDELKKDVEERKRVLQSIFHYFHTAFAMHVFGVTARQVQYRPIEVRALIKELEKVEREANEDPLQVDEEVAGLRREEHGQHHTHTLTTPYHLPLLSHPSPHQSLLAFLTVSSSLGPCLGA